MPFLSVPPGPVAKPDRSLALKLGSAGMLDRAMPQIIAGPKLRGRDLRRAGVTHVLNVAAEVGGRRAAKKGNARYSKCGMSNNQDAGLPQAELLSAWAFARSALGDPAPPASAPRGKRLLVHCRNGTHRSPAVAAFLISCLMGWSLDAAWRHITLNWPGAERVPAYMAACETALTSLRQMAADGAADDDGDSDDWGTGRPTRSR